jgi:hypothetical protein
MTSAGQKKSPERLPLGAAGEQRVRVKPGIRW